MAELLLASLVVAFVVVLAAPIVLALMLERDAEGGER